MNIATSPGYVREALLDMRRLALSMHNRAELVKDYVNSNDYMRIDNAAALVQSIIDRIVD